MSTRYFQTNNCNNRFKPEGVPEFTPYDVIGGKLFGVMVTEDAPLLAALDAALKEPKFGLFELSDVEYFSIQQKKTSGSNSLSNLNRPVPVIQQGLIPSEPPTPKPAAASVKGSGNAVVVAEPVVVVDDGPSPESGKVSVATVAEALVTAQVDPSPTAPVRQSRKGKGNEQQSLA